MAPSAEREWLEVWRLFLEVHARVVGRLEMEMESEQGIPLPWFDVLIQLSFAPDGQLRMHDLLRNLMLTRSGLTRRIDRMEAEELVERRSCSDDARGVVVVLTPLGRAKLADAAPHHLARVHKHFARHLTPQELRAVRSAFERVLAALDS